MRSLLSAVSIWLFLTMPVWGQVRQFPYEAVVQGDDVYVRSGPGQSYYPTLKLQLGNRVTVHRHDPGGWYMIAPPPGSFSLIDATLVQQTGETRGIVKVPPLGDGQAGRAIVRIGTEFGDDHEFYGRELANGDTVEIIGERTIATERGSVRMYQIKPPALEYRWVKGDFIVPAAEAVRQDHDLDPFAVPAAQKRETVTAQATPAPQPARNRIAESPSIPIASPAADGVKGQLGALDRQFHEMLALDPEQWQLDAFQRSYETLLSDAQGSDAALIQQRLNTIEARRSVQEQYLDFLRLTNETSQREAQLLSMQTGRPGTAPAAYPRRPGATPTPAAQPTPAVQPAPAAQPASQPGPQPTPVLQPGAQPAPQPTPVSQPGAQPGVTPGPTLGPIEPIPDEPLPEQNAPGVAPRFDGAGVIRRNNNMLGLAPEYVLVAPDGRFLAYLDQTENVNLAPYVGQAMGITGQRGFDPRVGADRIAVRRVTPVRLAPPAQP